MKKKLLLNLILFASINAIGQLNPVNNLSFEHWYEGDPNCIQNNCFILDWEEPDPSAQDTLVGYNVYRNSDLWRFQEFIGGYCWCDVCPDEDFYNYPYPQFWIKVKAVYNAAQLESPAIDSAFFTGLETSIFELEESCFKVQKNPIKRGKDIIIEIKNIQEKYIDFKVFNVAGVDITTDIKTITQNQIHIPTSTYNSGIYNILIRLKDNIVLTRILIIE